MLKILWVGKTKEKDLKNLINEYKKRILAMIPFRIIEIEEEKRMARDIGHSLKKEMDRIIENLGKNYYLIVLSEKGEMMSSEKFSDFLMDKFNKGKNISFVLGGPWGVSKELEEKANFLLSLSPMTFPHEIARVLLLEQIYRAISIKKGSKYHK
jgi:23S rRNA (pseudouridine1915-N3)-methyltransferase